MGDPPKGEMRVPAVLFGNEALISAMDQKVYEQAVNVAMPPGIVGASYAMPDAHWGYGFPIGGVAACWQCDEMGTLGSGNHYLEVQEVTALQRGGGR